MPERRVIQISTHSLSNIFPRENPRELLQSAEAPYAGGWHVRLARQLKQVSNEFVYECWGMEATLSKALEWEQDGLTFRVFPSRKLKYLGECSPSLLRELKKEDGKQASLIEIHELFSWTTFLAPLVVTRTPIIVQHHGSLSALQQCTKQPESWKKLGYLGLYMLTGQFFFERVSFRKAARIFVLNEEVQNYITRLVGRGRVERLTMGADFNFFSRMDKEAARRLLGLAPGERYILYVGSFVRNKGIPYLLQALATVLAEHPNTTLILVGQGYYRNALVKLSRKMGLDGRIRFEPPTEDGERRPDDMLPLYYSAADVFVVPSVYEGLGIVAIEAMACETPTIVTDVGGLPEIVKNFKGGIVVPPRNANALANAIRDVFSGERPFRVDRENAEKHYDWEAIAKRNLQVYEEVIEHYYS
jgi:glycosyltransferase involved in cell wall biosynthesis